LEEGIVLKIGSRLGAGGNDRRWEKAAGISDTVSVFLGFYILRRSQFQISSSAANDTPSSPISELYFPGCRE
jgi:hypothetical protein